MELSGNTVLITGGATGIGFAVADRLIKLGNTCIVCGRRLDRLEEARKRIPGLNIIQCDISKEEQRNALFEWIDANFKEMNVLVNNAGIQRKINLAEGMAGIEKNEDEIEINLRSQIYLAARFIPMLRRRAKAAIINVSSGLGFVPMAAFPIYSATKAAIRSFTMSLRQQLKGTSISVFEVIPPTVHDTELKGKPIPKSDYSISAAEMADAIIAGLRNDQYEIAAGASKGWISASREELDRFFSGINDH